jgi:GT2 family glycosyltransferase
MGADIRNRVGFVAIGRNEGARLEAGLRAIRKLCPQSPVVYVDSGSEDDSVAFARSLGMTVVELDLSIPFTAARARNAGFAKLIELAPAIEFVQFMDGDCELLPGWIETAVEALRGDARTAIVSGRRNERHPDATVYNQLIDIEWNTPVGETLAVLGDMCVRVDAFRRVDGFSDNVIAAEDDDFCLRVVGAGYRVLRLDADMSMHDANITKLSQWYRRSKRGGHGYANIYHKHGRDHSQYFGRALISAFLWGGAVPVAFLVSLWLSPTTAAVIASLYLLFIARAISRRKRAGETLKLATAYGFLIYTGKVYELMGVFQYIRNHALSRDHHLIEYK